MSSLDLATEIERFRERLLDLSLRNPLLSYRKSKRRTLQVVNKLPDAIFQRLVESGKPFVFDFVPDPPKVRRGQTNQSPRLILEPNIGPPTQTTQTDESEQLPLARIEEYQKYSIELPVELDEQQGATKHLFDDKLQTNLTQASLNSTLRYMQREARTAMQETGINYLFLAIGFLSWRETESSDKERLAPLILVPVHIEKISRGNGEPRFTIEWDEDEVQFNLSLQKKLARDFDLRLSEFGEQASPEAYFKQIHSSIKSKPDWSISREALLGFFSFHKLSMYADIDPLNWDLGDNSSSSSLLQKLVCGGGSELDGESGDARLYAPDYDIDQNSTVEKLLLSMDADSSQQSALVDIRNGKNLVIEGPPGTGKSQTITNAIADAIGAGKTVLFVAEKLAALQVVHDRMESLGLSDFCLELHSDAASPRHVFESLSSRLAAQYASPQNVEIDRELLNERRQRLNACVREMAKRVGPTREPLYDLLWRIIALRDKGARFVRSAIERIPKNPNDFQHATALLRTFAKVLAETPDPQTSEWWGFFPEGFRFRQTDQIATHLQEIEQAAAELRTLLNTMADEFGISPADTYSLSCKLAIDQVDVCIAAVPATAPLLTPKLANSQQASDCDNLLSIIAQKELLDNSLRRECGCSADTLLSHRDRLESLLKALDWSPGATLKHIWQTLEWLLQLQKELGKATTSVDTLARCDIAVRNLCTDFVRRIKLVQLIRHPVVADSNTVTSAMFDGSAKGIFRDAHQTSVRLTEAQEQSRIRLDSIVAGTSCNVTSALEQLPTLSTTTKSFIRLHAHRTPIDRIVEMLQWAVSAESLLDRVTEIASMFDETLVPRAGDFRAFVTSSAIVQLARHPVVNVEDCLSEAMFTNEGRRAFKQAFKAAEALKERKERLEASFHLQSIPQADEVKAIAKALRRGRASWLKFMNSEYRRARAKLNEFVAVGLNQKIDDWIRALEDLEALTSDELLFRDNEVYAAQLGCGFKGIDTDWETLGVRFDWVHTARQHGLDHRRAADLTGLRRKVLSDVSNRELRLAESSFKEHWFGEHTIAHIVASPIEATSFVDLKQRVRSFISRATEFVKLAELLELPITWSAEDVLKLASELQLLEQLEQESREFAGDLNLHRALGSNFSGMQTDWAQLDVAFNWVRTTKDAGGDWATVTKLFEHRPNGLSDFDVKGATECAGRLAELLAATPDYIVIQHDLASKSHETLASWIHPAINAVTEGLESADELTFGEQVTVDDVGKRLELAQACIDLEAAIADPNKWQGLRACGLYEVAISDPHDTRSVISWVAKTKPLVKDLPDTVSIPLISQADTTRISAFRKKVAEIRALKALQEQSRTQLEQFGRIQDEWLPLGRKHVLSGATEKKCKAILEQVDALPAWASFCRALQDCGQLKLRKFCDLGIVGQIAPERLGDSYQLSVLEMEAECALNDSEVLRKHSGQVLNGLRREFQEYDKGIRDVGKQVIAARAATRPVPAGNSRGRVGELTELALIRHESQKQRSHCRIRDLIRRAGAAVQALKPCLMMSPLSVSRFIPEGSVEFDLVIMDEASQIKPEDAIGTILRAKQLVVVGDPKQLPPTSFFDRLEEEVDEDESTQFDNTESVLEAAMKVFQPFRRLRWHYRSKHESLIRFSNTQFYDNDLVVFPSPTGDQRSYGIRHVLVEDATFVSGQNIVEAQAVVEEIVRHAIARPDESLGVGTFNKKQAELIAELLDKRCESDIAAALAIDKLRELDEDLFIKNLENLQGDERDVVFVCYTYGKDPSSGRLMQRFGPINMQNGWRRLNVLISRSRHRMVVFSSFQPSEVQGGPDKSRGVNAYKDFLQYAISGTLNDGGTVTGRTPDSPFEVVVCRHIERMGLEAVPQVGVAGFFIDIGVRRREGDRSFLLGIECDGATYHSAKCARDRDRLREEIILDRGWHIHRIWSTDWFLNQKAEVAKLEAAIRGRTEN